MELWGSAAVIQHLQTHHPIFASVFLGALFLLIATRFLFSDVRTSAQHLQVPAVPGIPVVGNLLQLREKKPHKTFTEWAKKYGPIFSIRTGASSVVVINSMDIAKEAMITRFSSISTRNITNALMVLTRNKTMVAMSDYADFHKTAKRHVLAGLLGSNPQRRFRHDRDWMMANICRRMHEWEKGFPSQPVDFRNIFESELFKIALKQALGRYVDSVYVEELGQTLSADELLRVLVHDPMEGVIEVDWRDFFPLLKWVPNSRMEEKLRVMDFRRFTAMKALIREQKQRIAAGEAANSYLDMLLSEDETLTEEQVVMLVWETIVETPDTSLVAAEWCMYELSKDRRRQRRLYEEICRVCGANQMTEDDLLQLPYLSAVFHETLRKHSPVPLIPLRHVHEDTELAGYHIPAGTEIAVNIYGCHMEAERWGECPEVWNPERFMDGGYQSADMYKTLAFGAGKRACAGAAQATVIVCTAVGRLVQEFEWRVEEEDEGDTSTAVLTSRKLRPLKAVLKPRTPSGGGDA